MATNPFENDDATYLVLVNGEGQYSLWPTFAEVPAGWTVEKTEDTRQNCLDYISEHWTDMRPRGLAQAMDS